jgi:hypothetical protein
MFALLAVIFFAVAFILHAFAHSDAKLVGDLEILGWLLIAAALLHPWAPWSSWSRRS